jgi:hypothetical protein
MDKKTFFCPFNYELHEADLISANLYEKDDRK